jgi:glucose-6-phosphate 1-dehydrogenase
VSSGASAERTLEPPPDRHDAALMTLALNGAVTRPSDALVFFGATGDLAFKQIFPALQSMIRHGRLDVPIVGVAKAGGDLDGLRRRAHESLVAHGGVDGAAFARLSSLLRYVDGDYRDPATFAALRRELGRAMHPLHYLAIPPALFETVVLELGRSGCADGARVVVEKPFGRDLASARALNRTLGRVFPERSTFRIDHYLGKEPVENLLYFRFANSFLEPIWNRGHVARVLISMAESFGVAGRGRLYDEVGAIRDVVQNHMIQVLTLLAMDPPSASGAEALRDAKVRLMRSISPLAPSNVVRGQYRGYHDEDGVTPDSTTETFAAVRLRVENPRWAGVPFLIRAGKRLPTTACEVLVELRRPPRTVFDEPGPGKPNALRFTLSPDVVIALRARAKTPGERMVGEDVELVARDHHPDEMPPYERLLRDAMRGDAALFTREDAVEAAWEIVDPILDDATELHPYRPGTWGPAVADGLLIAGSAHAGRARTAPFTASA